VSHFAPLQRPEQFNTVMLAFIIAGRLYPIGFARRLTKLSFGVGSQVARTFYIQERAESSLFGSSRLLCDGRRPHAVHMMGEGVTKSGSSKRARSSSNCCSVT
jgi:hypothetical protein